MADTRFFTQKEITIAELSKLCNCVIQKDDVSSLKITGCASLKSASVGEVAYLQVGKFVQRTLPKIKEELANTKASAIFIKEDELQYLPENIIPLITSNPKQAFITLLDYFYKEEIKYNIAPSSHIALSVKFKDKSKVFIGENCVIEEGVEVGQNCIIDSNVVIKKGCIIGDNCQIEPNVVISHSIIGNNCVFFRNCQIGSAGFGYEVTSQGFKYIQQIGRVIIGNDVEVGANTCIDRGALDDTVIGDGTKIDDLVMIGHNCIIGKNCFICGQAGLAGSSVLEDFVIIAGQAGVGGHLTIGTNSQIAAQSGVMKGVDPNSQMMGSPAMNIKDFLKITAFTKQMLKQGKKEKDD